MFYINMMDKKGIGFIWNRFVC